MKTTISHKFRKWSLRNDLENYKLNINFLKSHVLNFDDISLNKSIPWVFSHVPKAAGTTLENYLAQMFLIQDIIQINAPALNKFPEVLNMKNKNFEYIAGHHPLHGLIYQLLPKLKFIHLMMIREPIARVVSYYNYLLSNKTHALHPKIKDMNFNDFINDKSLTEISNGQSKRLAGMLHTDITINDHDLYNSSAYAIDNCFSLVGVTEKFKEFLKIIEYKCGFTFATIPNKNISESFLKVSDLNQQQIDVLSNKNSVDIKLYDYVYSKFEAIQTQKSK